MIEAHRRHPDDDPAFVDAVAGAIVDLLRPASALHVGCETGALVEALRARGVDAAGLDLRPQPGADRPPHGRAGSATAGLVRAYDLVVWLGPDDRPDNPEVAAMVAVLAAHAPALVFAPPSPGGWTETWSELFAAHQLYRHPDDDLGLIVPGLCQLRRVAAGDRALLAAYSQRLARLEEELAATRAILTEHVAAGIETIGRLELLLAATNALRQGREAAAADSADAQWTDLLAAAEADQVRLADQAAALEQVRRENVTLRAEVAGLRQWREGLAATPGWWVLVGLQGARARLAPTGSRRERLVLAAGAGLGMLRTHGLAWTVVRLRGRWRPAHTRLEVPVPPPVEPVRTHQTAVDIVVCVHNALEDVQRCLDSVRAHTSPPYTLILVDDGSDAPTRDFLTRVTAEHGARRLRVEQATGYTRAANRGLAAGSAPLVILLNSDTVVTPGWLDRLVAAIEADPGLAAVGPLANTASWQSIPAIEDAGDWAENPLPAGRTPADMATMAAADAERLRPDMPLLNGFCLLIRRSVVDQIGAFDEESFPYGYGEEDDFMLRARQAGWRLALAEDCYVYHAQSRSYSTARRQTLVPESQARIHAKHGRQVMIDGVTYCRFDPVLQGLRARSRWWFEREAARRELAGHWSGQAARFVVPPGGLSPAHPALAVAGVLSACGAAVTVVDAGAERSQGPPGIPILVGGITADDRTPDQAIVWHTDGRLDLVGGSGLRPHRGLAVDSGPFRPRRPPATRQRQDPLRVAAVVPADGRSAVWRTTIAVLRLIARPISLDVEVVWLDIHGFGPGAPALAGAQDVPWRWAPVPDARALAAALGAVDVVVDLGAPCGPETVALAAMASGTAVLVADTPATHVYARPEEDCLAADPATEDACAHQLLRLVRDAPLRRRLGDAALLGVPAWHPEQAALSLTDLAAGTARPRGGP